MKKERKENPQKDEFIEELLDEKRTEKSEEIGDSELFGKCIQEDEHDDPKEKKSEHGLDILEHGKGIKVPKDAVAQFAKAVGKSVGEVIEIYQKGCCFDELMRRFREAKDDSDAFEKISGIRGIGKEEMKAEILGVLENARLEKAVAEIEEANPGMNRETAAELAKFRIGAKKSEKEEKNNASDCEKIREKLKEIDLFMANHAAEGVETLDNCIIDEWEGGTPLEKAFADFMLKEENEKLRREIEKMKEEKDMENQRGYAREHSAGSVSSHAGKAKLDEFIEGLFREY